MTVVSNTSPIINLAAVGQLSLLPQLFGTLLIPPCAIECRADWLLIDERRGRTIARRFGLRVLGLLGVLLQAKRDGLIDTIAPILTQLTDEAGFRIDQALYRRVLIAAGEAPDQFGS